MRITDNLWAHQQQPDSSISIERTLLFAFIPFFVRLESFKQLWRIRMIDADNRHRFGRFDLDATKIPGDITCDRVKQHRTNVVRRRLKEVAEQQKVVLNV